MKVKIAGVMLFLWRAWYPLMIYLLVTSVTGIAMLVMGFAPWGTDALLTTAIAAAISSLWLGILYRKTTKTEERDVHWNGRVLALLLLMGAGSCLFFNQLITLTGLTSDAYEKTGELLFLPPLLLQILGIGIVIPIAEELVFRGLGYFCMRKVLSFGPAALVSSLYFALFHGNIVQGVYAAALGLLLAYVCEVCRTVWAPICFHMAANLTSLLFTYLIPEIMSVQKVAATLLLSGLLLLFGIYQIRKDRMNHEITVDNHSML